MAFTLISQPVDLDAISSPLLKISRCAGGRYRITGIVRITIITAHKIYLMHFAAMFAICEVVSDKFDIGS